MRTRLKLALVAFAALAGFGILRRAGSQPLHGGPLLVDDPKTLLALEKRGLSFERIVGRDGLIVIEQAITEDMTELTKGAPSDSPRRPFKPEWLAKGSFELVGLVNRLDRRGFDAATCGEVRLVYRLAFKRIKKRAVTRLPMTVNVRIPQPKPKGGDCRAVAERWLERPDLVTLVGDLPRPTKVEVNYQSIHVPGSQQDMDDNAEYVLRAFDVAAGGDTLVRGHLFNTPRTDLTAAERAKLLAWIDAHVKEIDEGTAVVPDELLATRMTSVSPRGLVHLSNRPFSQIVGEPGAAFGHLALERRTRVRTPELLLRRLDELTCVGCHQTRGIAGFHLLGEERDTRTFNALAVGHSPHLGADLAWRELDLANAAKGQPLLVRPFAAFPNGRYGSECGLVPGLAEWKCEPGLVCRDIHHADWGVCAPSEGVHPGEPCEDVTVKSAARPLGALVTARGPDVTCPAPIGAATKGAFCAPNWLGFTGGMCSETCSNVGEVKGASICASLPSAGYEADCFLSREPIEECLQRHFARARVAKCDASTPCRDDYGCARVEGAPSGVGACVPPYFIFQARVDGPLLDR